MNKLLSCRSNMATNREQNRYAEGNTHAIKYNPGEDA